MQTNNNYDLKYDTNEKDILITRLKEHIFQLEQNERDYHALNHKFRNTQNE